MASVCVLCGKEYKKDVTKLHIKSHKISLKKYAEKADSLPEEAWAFYWSEDEKKAAIRKIFPDPVGSRKNPYKGFKTFEDWGRDRHPEWW